MTSGGARLVVVGGGAAAAAALGELRRQRYEGHVVVVGRERHLPYNRTTVNKGLLEGHTSVDEVRLDEGVPENVQWELGSSAAELDLDARRVHLADGRRVHFDGLLIASGADGRPLAAQGESGVLQLRTLDDALVLRDRLRRSPRRVLVVGAGLIGTETASLLAAAGSTVTLVDASPLPLLHQLGEPVATWVRAQHLAHGVEVRTGVRARAVSAAPHGDRVVLLDDGEEISADLVLSAQGAQPAVHWLTGSGLELADGVLCDSSLRVVARAQVAVPAVVAAGDVARWPHPVFGSREIRVEHWGNALEQGRHAARTLLRDLGAEVEGAQAYDELPAYTTSVHGRRLHVLGLPHLAAAATFVRGDVDAERFAVAYTDDRGVVVGAVAVSGAKPVAALRPLVAQQRPLEVELPV